MLNRYAQSDSLVKNKKFKLTFGYAATNKRRSNERLLLNATLHL